MPDKLELRQAMPVTVKRDSINRENRTMTIVASTPAVDRYRSIFLLSAFPKWMPRYMGNPVICDNHQTWLPPVGRTLAWRIQDNTLEKDIQFAPSERGLEWFQLYADGYANGWSIHGEIHDVVFWWEQDRLALLPPFARVALESGEADYVITDFEIWETSCATVPGNAETKTLRQAVAEGRVSLEAARSLILPPAPRFGITPELRASREELQVQLDVQLRSADGPAEPTPETEVAEESQQDAPAQEPDTAPDPTELERTVEGSIPLDAATLARALCSVLVEHIDKL